MARVEEDFLAVVLADPVVAAVLGRAPRLGLPDWWLAGGALAQAVWNALDGRPPGAGVADYDLFYFDAADTSWAAEDRVIRAAAALFADLDAVVEVRNEARVHLWYEARFGVPARPFTSSRDAVDHFASTTCCLALTSAAGVPELYAPHGLADVFARRVRPNPVLAPRQVYESKARRWAGEWPTLVVEPWPG
ncbi:nucleotidyltransferase family protein [Geodermatophilus sp. SYSU D00758]